MWKMKTKLAQTLEIIWLITSLICLLSGIHQTYYEGFSKSYMFFIFSLVAFIIYQMRKQIRKTKNDNPNE